MKTRVNGCGMSTLSALTLWLSVQPLAVSKNAFLRPRLQVRIGLVNYGYHDDLDDPKFFTTFWGDEAPPQNLTRGTCPDI